jgi:hypothetical protein
LEKAKPEAVPLRHFPKDIDNIAPEKKVDIAPLIRLRKRCPGSRLRFQDGLFHTMHEPDAMMDVYTNKTWWEYLDRIVSQVFIEEAYGGFIISILVKKECGRDWMGLDGRRAQGAVTGK